MKRVLFVALLALALPMAVFASSSTDFTASDGTLSGLSGGLTLSGSTLAVVDGLYGGGRVASPDLGSVSLSTGALLSSIYTKGVLTLATFASGGSLVITGNGTDGIPSGTIFTGAFTNLDPTTLTKIGNSYVLSGTFAGTLSNGTVVSGTLIVLTSPAGGKGYLGQIGVGSVDINMSPVPEPGTLTLLGTGLVGLAGAIRRKLAA
jgi:PEP-CTERM motif-containing protein